MDIGYTGDHIAEMASAIVLHESSSFEIKKR